MPTSCAAAVVLLLRLTGCTPEAGDNGQQPQKAESATTTEPAPQQGWRWSGSLRSRVEIWDWFNPAPSASLAEDNYAFFGSYARLSVAKTLGPAELVAEASVPVLLNLPEEASLLPPQGQLGHGASYRDASGDRVAFVLARQAYVRFAGFPDQKSAVRLGRFEFLEGQEGLGQDPTLDWIKRERIAQRLIAHFAFTHVQRTTDGGELARSSGPWHLLAAAGRPTEGVFKLNGNRDVRDVWFTYVGLTRATSTKDLRLFHIFYRDSRDTTKADPRPASVRALDNDAIDIFTAGAHYAHRFGRADVLLYGAVQNGGWGTQSHLAGTWVAEAGYQPDLRGRPWFRMGVNQGSGDRNALDDRHGTFFQILPTARIYARFPFYNMMNSEDVFLQAILRPHPRLALRGDVRRLRLSSSTDLWYAGGGVFDSSTFGFTGRPSSGHRSVATLSDLQADVRLDPRTSLTLYYGHATGGEVVRRIYPASARANLAFVEVSRRF